MLPSIILTHSTHAELATLVRMLQGTADEEVLEFLEQELGRAHLVPDAELDPGVATIGSRVLYREEVLGTNRVGTLIIPGNERRVFRGISVLEPAGACLLGLSEGQSMAFWSKGNAVCKVTLSALLPR